MAHPNVTFGLFRFYCFNINDNIAVNVNIKESKCIPIKPSIPILLSYVDVLHYKPNASVVYIYHNPIPESQLHYTYHRVYISSYPIAVFNA